MNNQKGFTLIELMIVIAIIAILAAIALPAYNNYVAKSQVTEAISLASSFKTPVSLFVTEEGSCPLAANNGFAKKEGSGSDNLGQFVKSIEFTKETTKGGCVITAKMGDTGVNAKVRGGSIILTSTAPNTSNVDSGDTGITKWTCTATGVPASMLPKSCTLGTTPSMP